MAQKYPGHFITFEGVDGSGKTTQIGMLFNRLRDEKRELIVTREPGGTPIGEALRDLLLDIKSKDMLPLSEMLLYAAGRAQHTGELILPALENGKIVLCDRYVDSSLVYQGQGRGLGMDAVIQVNRVATSGLTLANPQKQFMMKFTGWSRSKLIGKRG